MLVQGNVGNFKKLGVVFGCGLANSPLQNSLFSHPQMYHFRVLAGKPKLGPFLVNWENVVFIYSIFFII